MRILIAEDESIIRLDLRRILERAGYEVCAEARNGAEAVQLAHETEPEAAVIDVRMPEMSGIEAVRRILAERSIPIVMLTAYADPGTVTDAIRAGVFAYVVKPFREQDLLPAIETACVRQREWLCGRPGLDHSPERSLEGLDMVIGEGRWPLRIERLHDGSIDVQLIPGGEDS
jgi:two-component system, response regulator PdtaR